MKSPNPTLTELEQWLDELPTIEEIKNVTGFEIGKAYYLVRIGVNGELAKKIHTLMLKT